MHQSVLMLVMGLLGIVIYNLYKILPHLSDNTFLLSIFIKENRKHLVWTLAVMIVAMSITTLDPTTNEIVTEWTGLDLAGNSKGWLLFGVGLSGMVRNTSKKKLPQRLKKIRS